MRAKPPFLLPLDWVINIITNFSIMSYMTNEIAPLRFFALIGMGSPFLWLVFSTHTLERIKEDAWKVSGLG